MRKIFLMCVLICYKLYGQGLDPNNRLYHKVEAVPPNYINILRYDKIPDVGFAGGIDINIPIYEIKMDNNLSIPLKLSYNSKGFKLEDIASNVGLGWNLLGEGMITLQVNDIDDFTKTFQTLQYDFSLYEPDPPNPCITRLGYLQSGYNPYYPAGPPQDLQTDSSPDFYSVNAPGLKTKFFMEKDLSLCPSENCTYDKFKYNIKFLDFGKNKAEPVIREEYFHQPPQGVETDLEIKKFTITNNLGYRYNFSFFSGVDVSSYDGNIADIWRPITDMSSGYNNIWYLSSIESPTNKKVEYFYEDYINNYDHLQFNVKGGQGHIFNFDFGIGDKEFSLTPEGAPLYFQTTQKIKTRFKASKRLKKIVFENGVVNFFYNNPRQDYAGDSLDKVEIRNNQNQIIKSFDFLYSYFLPKESNCNDNYNCLRLRLDKIVETNVGSYLFSYGQNNGDYVLPKRTSTKVDFLGYYNNNPSDYNGGNSIPTYKYFFYPNLPKSNFLPFKLQGNTVEYTSGDYDYSSNSESIKGLLSKIQFPTGGIAEYEFENDTFEFLGHDYILGTTRIKSYTLRDNSSIVRKVLYDYTLENGKSSGQISNLGLELNLPTKMANSNSYFVIGLRTDLSYNLNTYIGYSTIKKIELGNGKTITTYKNYNDVPNEFPLLINTLPSNLTANEIKALEYFSVPGKNIIDKSAFRGLITGEYYYKEGSPIPSKYTLYEFQNKSSTLLNTTFNIFKRDPYPVPSLSGPNNLVDFSFSSKINRMESLMTNKKEYSNFNNNIVKEISTFEYANNTNLLSKKEVLSTDENIIKTQYKYSEDKNIVKLINANIVARPIETELRINDKLVKKEEIKYESGLNVLPTSVLTYDINTPSQSINELTYDLYDGDNLLNYTLKKGKPISILWGYNKTLPIAKVEGIGYIELGAIPLVEQIVTKSNNDTNTNSEDILISALDDLRKLLELQGALITTYTYDPLIGVTSITPPSGIREFYIYDGANRLKEIRHNSRSGKLIKEYKYNYSPVKYFNPVYSQNFIKNNCPAGMMGSSFTYTIPAYTYSSTVSQTDVNQQAQNLINSNGQNLANNNGTCTTLNCSFGLNNSLISGGASLSWNDSTSYKISGSYTFNSNLNWMNGVIIGKLNGNCLPSVIKTTNFYSNGLWLVEVHPNGDLIVKFQVGPTSSLPSNGTIVNMNIVVTYN